MFKGIRQMITSISLTQLCWLAIALCIPAFFINLGRIGFIGDEGIRTLVAFEMKLSGNMIVPTMCGEAYYNKPPLYNWFIMLTSEMYGSYGEWPTRLTTLFFLGIFALTVYYITRQKFDRLTSVTMAFLLVTSGRILFWDGMLGLIDICFSWVIYLNFMVLYFLAKAKRWRTMFILSYLLFSIAFLLKGFPAFVFQGISVITALIIHKVFKQKIFSSSHWIGIGVGIIPVLVYYILYSSRVNLEHVFSILMEQSMKRTATHHSITDTLKHILTFPFEQSYHFLPWSLLVVFAFYPKFRKLLQSNDFIQFNFWMFVANIPVYWFSVEVYPRYLLMFIPLFNLVGYYVFLQSRAANDSWWKFFRFAFLGVAILGLLAAVFMPLVPEVSVLPYLAVTWILGIVFLGFVVLGLFFDEARTFLWFAIALLVVRSIFNMVVLPIRAIDDGETIVRTDCLRVAKQYNHLTWYILGPVSQVNTVSKVYTSININQIIHGVDNATDPDGLYIVDMALKRDFPGTQIDSLTDIGGKKFALMRMDDEK